MYQYKDLDLGFVILAPDRNPCRVRSTFNSIKNNYGLPCVCAAGGDATAADMKELKDVCPTYKGKDTMESLINTGIKKGNKAWNILVLEGTWIQRNIDRKYSYYIEDEKDVLFPITTTRNKDGYPVEFYNTFEKCTLNGIMIHQKTFKSIGNFTEEDEFSKSKFIWAMKAFGKGCKFKAILGVRII